MDSILQRQTRVRLLYHFAFHHFAIHDFVVLRDGRDKSARAGALGFRTSAFGLRVSILSSQRRKGTKSRVLDTQGGSIDARDSPRGLVLELRLPLLRAPQGVLVFRATDDAIRVRVDLAEDGVNGWTIGRCFRGGWLGCRRRRRRVGGAVRPIFVTLESRSRHPFGRRRRALTAYG
jgi:hypothetical protein